MSRRKEWSLPKILTSRDARTICASLSLTDYDVRALFPGRAHDAYLLQEVKITKLRWTAKFGLNVGTIRSSLLQVLGRPDSEKPDFVEYSHSMGIGTVRIW